MTWPSTWPSDVADWYESLAVKFGWPEPMITGVIANVEYLRQLDESDLPRSYLQGEFEDVRWLFEAVLSASR